MEYSILCKAHFVYTFIHQWLFGLLLPPSYCQQWCCECEYTDIFLGTYSEVELSDCMVILYLFFEEWLYFFHSGCTILHPPLGYQHFNSAVQNNTLVLRHSSISLSRYALT